MKIVVDINHPADVNYFKNFIWEMEKREHEVMIIATDKDISIKLLNNYGFKYNNLGSYGGSRISKLIKIPLLDFKMYNAIKSFDTDLLLGFGSIRAAHVSYILHKICILFEDTEHSMEQIRLYLPFADAICTPCCFRKDLGKKQVRFDGYKELAYLHPKYFTPNPAVLDEVGLGRDDTFIVVRFVSWTASHDVGQHGIRDKVGMVRELEKHGRVLITSEGQLPKELQPYQVPPARNELHDLLYYATLYVGESTTMASESAVLGTHAIYINTRGEGYIAEEDKYYELVSDFSSRTFNDHIILDEARRLLQNQNLRREGKKKGEKLIRDKIDVTAFMVWFVENYPDSMYQIKERPEIQKRFRSN